MGIDDILRSLGTKWSALPVVIDFGDGHAVRQLDIDNDAIALVERIRDAFPATGIWPLMLSGGSQALDDVAEIHSCASITAVGQAAVDASRSLDVATLLPPTLASRLAEVARGESLPEPDFYDGTLDSEAISRALPTVSARFQGVVIIGEWIPSDSLLLVPCEAPWEALARVGFGAWNECPGPAEQAAYSRAFSELVGATPRGVGRDIALFESQRTPIDLPAAIELARLLINYCCELTSYDEPGVIEYGQPRKELHPAERGTHIVASLLAGPGPWGFWWD